jgi:hypothetical protein
MKQSRIRQLLHAEGLRWRKQEGWFGERIDPQFAEKRGASVWLRLQTPAKSLILDIDEMGPVAAKSYPGRQLIDGTARPAERAKQELDYGRRGKGYVFGAFSEMTGDCYTQCYSRRTAINFLDFLCFVDAKLPADVERVYAIMDKPSHASQ